MTDPIEPMTERRLKEIEGRRNKPLFHGHEGFLLDECIYEITRLKAVERELRGDWDIVHNALKGAQQQLELFGVRYTWLDTPTSIAAEHAARKPITPTENRE